MAEFRSKSPNLTLYMGHVTRTHDANGNVVATTPSRRIRFDNGVYHTKEAKELKFLRSHRFYGNRFVEVAASAPERVPQTPPPNMQRGNRPDGGDKGDGGDKVLLPCDYEGCDYVAEDDTLEGAKRRLNGHRTARGHHTED